ncbi:MAG: gliding motility-associated C-terminal domain-containing protein [Chitinophagaceae bacterium]|jgi:gliding motility-associated-like protein
MKPSFLLLISFLIIIPNALAQKENNIWTFGKKTGLDFNSGSPVVIKTSMTTIESSTSVCSADGSLLFYTDGITVWNQGHIPMPNGTGLLGNDASSGTQAISICQFPNDPKRYYIISVNAEEVYIDGSQGYLRYSVVDMRLNGGTGDVVVSEKNILLDSNTNESFTLARGNGCTTWIIAHIRGDGVTLSNRFDVFKIDASGISRTPVVSSIGMPTGKHTSFMTISPNNRMLFRNGNKHSQLFDFDNNTGIISNVRTIDTADFVRGSCFSPDGSKIYLHDQYSRLLQYNLSYLPSASAVKASKTLIEEVLPTMDLRGGPDGRVYISILSLASFPDGKVGIIPNPNVAGTACGFYTIPVPNTWIGLGENALTFDVARTNTSKLHTISLCERTDTTVDISRGMYETYLWNDGDTSRKKKILLPAKVWVTTQGSCTTHTDTFIFLNKTRETKTSTTDIADCHLTDTTFSFPSIPGEHFIWSDGDSSHSKKMNAPSLVWLMRQNGCKNNIDTFNIRKLLIDTNIKKYLVSDCKRQDTTIKIDAHQYDSFKWNDGDTASVKIIRDSETKWIEILNGCSVQIDTFSVKRKPIDTITLKNDLVFCNNEIITLKCQPGYTEYFWDLGSKDSFLAISEAGSYVYTARKQCTYLTESFLTKKLKCDSCLNIPNAFTPNNDFRNDVFKSLLSCPVLEYQMLIVNRYGEKVFESNDPATSWDGTYNGHPESAGVFYYFIKVKFDYPQSDYILYKGDVLLIR